MLSIKYLSLISAIGGLKSLYNSICKNRGPSPLNNSFMSISVVISDLYVLLLLLLLGVNSSFEFWPVFEARLSVNKLFDQNLIKKLKKGSNFYLVF